MKKSVLLLASFLLIASSAIAQEVKFSIGEWAPYTGEKIAKHGMATEIVSAACLAGGLKPIFEFVPWKRAEAYVTDGASFATFPYTDIASRQGKFLFSSPIFSSSFAVLVHAGNPNTSSFVFSGVDSFKGFKIGYTSGTDAVRLPLEKAGAKLEDTANLDTSVKKLELDRIDFVVDDRAVIFDTVQNLYAGTARNAFKILDKGFGDKTAFKVMVSLKYPGSELLLKKLNDGLTKIQANGTYDKILAAYGMTK